MEDSYATLSLSTQPKKTISSTRVLTNDKNPRWNENLYVLLSQGWCLDYKLFKVLVFN
jgi:Ca2+-dependent lipid-binding protein